MRLPLTFPALGAHPGRYADGPLGMLHVEEEARRRGLASALLARATAELRAAGEPCFAYIVDGNAASEGCFERQGWARAASADWVGFEMVPSS